MSNEATIDYILGKLDEALLQGREVETIRVKGWESFSTAEYWLLRKEGWEYLIIGREGKFSPEEGNKDVITIFNFFYKGSGDMNVGDKGLKNYKP